MPLTTLIPPPVEHDPDRHFQTDHLKDDLGRRSARATALLAGDQAVIFVLRMVSTVVLARLLTPEDYGLFGMVTVLVAFITVFIDFGLSMAAIQKHDLTHSDASDLFWINVGASVVLTLVLLALSPVLVWFYDEPRLAPINIVLALSLLPGGLRVQHAAIMRRQLLFGRLVAVDMISQGLGLTVGIAVGWFWRDYWALVSMQLSSTIASTFGLWLVCGWRPSLPRRFLALRPQLRFGANLTGSQVLAFFTTNLDNVLVGWYWGASELGVYGRAYQLVLFPVQQITSPLGHVAMLAMSRLQGDSERLRRYYCKALNLMALAIVPMIAVLAALADEVVVLILGASWMPVATIFKALAIAAILEPFMSSTAWIMFAMGRADRLFGLSLLITPMLLFSFVLGLPWGGQGVAIAYSTARCFLFFPCFCFALRNTPIRYRDVIASLWRPVSLGAIVYMSVIVTRACLVDRPLMVLVSLSCLAGLGVLLVVIVLWPQARAESMDLVEVFRRTLSRAPARAAATPLET
jgi:O-antigen/teichoic acid export membrane protein